MVLKWYLCRWSSKQSPANIAVKLNTSNAMAPPAGVPNATAVMTVAEHLSKPTCAKPVIPKLNTKSSRWCLTAQVCAIRPECSKLTVTRLAVYLKKSTEVVSVNPKYAYKGLTVSLKVDEMWAYVGKKSQPRWLWWVEDALSGEVVAFVFGRRTHQTFRALLKQLQQAQLSVVRWITDAWWAYFDCLDQSLRIERKALLQSLERKHLTLRTRIKRLARRTICFSKSVLVHDTLIGLFINHYFFNHQRS